MTSEKTNVTIYWGAKDLKCFEIFLKGAVINSGFNI